MTVVYIFKKIRIPIQYLKRDTQHSHSMQCIEADLKFKFYSFCALYSYELESEI